MKTTTKQGILALGQALQRAGPYVLIEIVLPGGTLLALLLLLYRLGPARVSAEARRVGAAAVRALTFAVARSGMRLQANGAVWFGPALPRGRDGLEPLGFAPD